MLVASSSSSKGWGRDTSQYREVGNQISTKVDQNLGLKAILLALGTIAGFASLHQASRPMIFYAMEWTWPMIYDWSTSLRRNMKQLLSYCKMGRKRNFGLNSILSAFFFERVPGLSPRVDIAPHGVRYLSHLRWSHVMQRLGGGRVANSYPVDLFL